MLISCRTLMKLFRPHIHSVNCTICSHATAVVGEAAVSRNESNTHDHSSTPALSSSFAAVDAKYKSPSRVPHEKQNPASLLSRENLAREALLRWLKLSKSDVFAESKEKLSQDEVEEQAVTTPIGLSFPCHDTVALPTLLRGAHRANAFLAYLSRVPTQCLSPGGVEKQLRFQAALLSMQTVLKSRTRFDKVMLVCGTALGAHREGFFIPHDDDIDVGVYWHDLVHLGKQLTAASDATTAEHYNRIEENDAALAGGAVQRILSDLTCHGGFIVFDVCGSVNFGLEVRLLHADTHVRVDMNVYYESSGEEGVNCGRPFDWCATFYEEADKRAYGMYRYWHTPFRANLIETRFCGREPSVESSSTCESDSSFLLPPTSYLEEYFGADWRTPKRFSYEEGLKGEYKNIIAE